MEEKDVQAVSRRSFLKGGAAIAAGLTAAAGVAGLGCTSTTAASKDGAQASSTEWDREADVLIVGSGYSGMAAAVEAAEAGLRVLVIEKEKQPGGNSIMCGGGCQLGGGTRFQLEKAPDVEDSPDIFFDDLYKMGGYRGVPEILRTFVDHCQDTADFLEGLGLNFANVTAQELGKERMYSAAPGNYPGATGISFWYVINERASELGVETLLETFASDLVMDDAGDVIGLVVEKDGKTVNYKANNAVVLASGGWKGNLALRQAYDPRYDEDYITSGEPYVKTMGEMLPVVERAGGMLTGMSFIGAYALYWGTSHYPYWEPADIESVPDVNNGITIKSWEDIVVVDGNGKRFVDERTVKADSTSFHDHVLNLPDRPRAVWAVFDSAAAAANGIDVSVLETVKTEEKPHLDQDYVAVGSTIEEIAEKMGVPASGLAATVESYNAFVASGVDEDFAKEGMTAPVAEAPFYAVRAGLFAHNTFGGIRVNERCQVVKAASEQENAFVDETTLAVIPHLYASGECVGSWFGKWRGGGKIGFHITFGRIAGQNAAAEPKLA